jgi:hypothetical protein
LRGASVHPGWLTGRSPTLTKARRLAGLVGGCK